MAAPVWQTPAGDLGKIQEAEFYKKAQEEYSKGRKNPLTQQEMLAILEDRNQTSDFSKAVKLGSKGRFAISGMEGF